MNLFSLMQSISELDDEEKGCEQVKKLDQDILWFISDKRANCHIWVDWVEKLTTY